jgi:RNA polymerase sigma-70 factor, ECF subfamily
LSGNDQSYSELLVAVRLGDRGAFHALYHRFAGELYALCERILHSRDEAEDVVADVFCEIWNRRERFDSNRGGGRTYLTTLARSRSIDRLRSRQRRLERNGQRDREGIDSLVAPGAAPDDSAAASEARQRVVEVLARLSLQQRQAMELAYYEGLSHQQIADRMAAPLGTVKTHIRQGLIKLRAAMNAPNANAVL